MTLSAWYIVHPSKDKRVFLGNINCCVKKGTGVIKKAPDWLRSYTINPPKEPKQGELFWKKKKKKCMGKGKVSLSLEVRNRGVGKFTLKERDLKK